MDNLLRGLLRNFPETSIDDILRNTYGLVEFLVQQFAPGLIEHLLPSVPGIVWMVLVVVIVLFWIARRN